MKINMVIACLLGTALTLGGYASTSKSESGFTVTATLPDGKKREMHLFKTWKEMDAYTAKIGFERTRWHMKFDASPTQRLKFAKKDAKFNEVGYYAQPYSFDEIGEIGKVMKEKGLPWAVYAFKNGSEWRTIGVVAQNKKYSLFRFSIIDYIDEKAYQRVLAQKKEVQEKAQKKTTNSLVIGKSVYRVSFVEHSDGCLVFPINQHRYYDGPNDDILQHRSDTAAVNAEIKAFNAQCQRLHAVSESDFDKAFSNTQSGHYLYMYKKSHELVLRNGAMAVHNSGRRGSREGIPMEHVPLYTYIIYEYKKP